MYKISVIVPIYNVEEFIEEAIQSVIKQSIGFENIQLLLIDDCSTDRSGEIAQKYSKKYENIIYYKLSKNSGMAGKPRNIGINIATGKYLMFLDPDDYYLSDACQKMYDCIEKENVKFVTSNLKDVDIDGNDLNNVHIDPKIYPSQKFTITDIRLALKVMKHSCPVKIILREFILEHKICFLESIPAEDAYFTSEMFLIAKEAFFQSEPILCYRRRTVGNVSETNKLNERFFLRMIKANKEIYKLFQKHKEDNYYRYYYIDTVIYILRKLIISSDITIKDKLYILDEMQELLSYWEKGKLPQKIESDSYKILELINSKNRIDKEKCLSRLEKVMKSENINAIRKMEKRMINEIEEILKCSFN